MMLSTRQRLPYVISINYLCNYKLKVKNTACSNLTLLHLAQTQQTLNIGLLLSEMLSLCIENFTITLIGFCSAFVNYYLGYCNRNINAKVKAQIQAKA
jgi:hypothetical protein